VQPGRRRMDLCRARLPMPKRGEKHQIRRSIPNIFCPGAAQHGWGRRKLPAECEKEESAASGRSKGMKEVGTRHRAGEGEKVVPGFDAYAGHRVLGGLLPRC